MPTTTLPPMTDDDEVVAEPEQLLDMRWLKRGAKFVEQHLVK